MCIARDREYSQICANANGPKLGRCSERIRTRAQAKPSAAPFMNIERDLLEHTRKDSHPGYGQQWFMTLKRAVEVIPNPLIW